jgi:hypothetical protein
MRRLAVFLGASLAFWVLVAVPARHLWGDTALAYSAVALGLCLVPTAVTLAWAARALHGSPEQQLLLVLGGTGLRMFAVLTAGLVLYLRVEYFQKEHGFWIWILVFYLFTLAAEMTLILSGRPGREEAGR